MSANKVSVSAPAFFAVDAYPKSESTKMSLGEIYNLMSGDDPELRVPDYQREYVWSKKQQERYLESLSRNMPISGPVINIDTTTGIKDIIDGQNRILTIFGFLNDEIKYNGVSFSELPSNEKRRIKNMKMAYTETGDWSRDQCQELFVRIQEGVKLKDGELIHARSDNDLTKNIVHILKYFENFLKNKPKDGGLGFTPNCIKRYGHYEILGTIIHMVRTCQYPIRPGKTALSESDLWDDLNTPTRSQRDSVVSDTKELLHKYSQIVANVPKLKVKQSKEEHLRIMYFIYKSELWKQSMNEDIYNRIDALLNRVLNKDNPEYDQIIKYGTSGVDNIYELYHSIY